MRRQLPDFPRSRAATWSNRLSLFSWALALVGVGVARSRAVEPGGALATLGAAELFAFVALGLAALAAVEIWRTGARGAGAALVGFVFSLLLIAPLAALAWLALSLPAVRTLSTDLAAPPSFIPSSKALAARGGPVPPAMTREEVEAQTAAYPDIRSIVVKADVSVVYPLAQQAAKDLGWRILDSAAPGARGGGTALIDAASSDWVFRFEDEIAIRLTPGEAGTTVDLRSVSGVGRHDFGANARRIRAFAAALKESAPAR